MTGNEKLHGGAQRLPARVINDETMSSQRISWYEIAPGDQCTRHVHEGKFETWLVILGTGVSHVGERKFGYAARIGQHRRNAIALCERRAAL